MGNPRGVKRDFDAFGATTSARGAAPQEGRARGRGGPPSRGPSPVRESLGATTGRGRPQGLKKAGRAGRKPRLTDTDLRQIEHGLKQGPEALGYSTSLWTAQRAAVLITQLCGVRFHPGHVWRLLGQLGWSCQRPAGRALERDEVAIRRWKRQRWPGLKKKPSSKARPSSSSTRAG
jgi:Transposase and inactivated derivatives